jgi:hypothetical protein
MAQPTGERCELCRYELAGTCHFNPPLGSTDIRWPAVAPADWCGHFKTGAVVDVDEPDPFEEFDK